MVGSRGSQRYPFGVRPDPTISPWGSRSKEMDNLTCSLVTAVTLSSVVPLVLWQLDTARTRMNPAAAAADLTSEDLDSCA